jgi:transposase-like protein
MDKPDCPRCTASSKQVEGPLSDGGWFCNGCAEVFHLDAAGQLVKSQPTNHGASTAFGQALRKALESKQ